MTVYNHGDLEMIIMNSSADLGEKVIKQLANYRGPDYNPDTLRVPIQQVRFSNGEAKTKILDTVRGKDVYILTDVGNYGCTYKMFGKENRMSPDDHFQDIKRVINALGGKANRVNVIMPLLYASRQHKRNGRESLDCAMALRELEAMGVNTVLTFDAHDPTIYNSISKMSFENIMPTYSMLKKLLLAEGTDIYRGNMMVISPDTGAMNRAIYFAGALGGLDVGMFYKRRDYSKIVNGKNPIIQHQYIGGSLEGKSVLIVDDMIASGESVIDVIKEISKYNVSSIFLAATFAFFTEGVEKFDKLYEEGRLTKLYTTNLTYAPAEVKSRPWFVEVDMSRFLAKVIDTMNKDKSISSLLDASKLVRELLTNSDKNKRAIED